MGVLDRLLGWTEGRIDPFAEHRDYQPPDRFLPYVLHYVRQARLAFALVLLFAVLNAAVEAIVFTYVGNLVDILTQFLPQRETGWPGLIEAAGPALAWMVGVALLARVLIVLCGAILEEQVIVPGFFTLMRWQSHKHIIRQSLSFFQNDLSGRIAQKVFQSGNAVGDMMVALIQTMGFITAFALTTFGVLLSLNPWLGLTVALWFAGFVGLARFFVPRIRHHGRLTAEAGAVATGRMVDSYSNITTVKLHGSLTHENDWVREGMRGQYEALKRFTRQLTGVRVSLSLLSNFMVVILAAQSVDLWLKGTITLGQTAFSLALVLRLSLLLNRLMNLLNGFFRNVGTAQNTMELVARPLGITDRPNAVALKLDGGDIRLEGITFNYEKEKPLYRDFSLEIGPGEKVGIVGPSGAGKSTLVSLILRFFDVAGGRILIDGQDIRDVTQDSLRACFSLVQQETAIFHRSVRENIAHGRPGAGFEEIVAAARKAHAHDFIETLQDSRGRRGYEARVGERGVQLSGGQRQRIAIARVMLRDAPILILDEATSQLDSGIEAAIRENLDAMMEGKTVIAIAHRLSTLQAMDRLVVIDDGVLVEEGSHHELLAKSGLYASLWARQSGGFIADTA